MSNRFDKLVKINIVDEASLYNKIDEIGIRGLDFVVNSAGISFREKMVWFLVSPASKYITSQDFPVDGGALAFCY